MKKKLITIVLASCTLLSLAACDFKDGIPSISSASETTTEETSTTAESETTAEETTTSEETVTSEETTTEESTEVTETTALESTTETTVKPVGKTTVTDAYKRSFSLKYYRNSYSYRSIG